MQNADSCDAVIPDINCSDSNDQHLYPSTDGIELNSLTTNPIAIKNLLKKLEQMSQSHAFDTEYKVSLLLLSITITKHFNFN